MLIKITGASSTDTQGMHLGMGEAKQIVKDHWA